MHRQRRSEMQAHRARDLNAVHFRTRFHVLTNTELAAVEDRRRPILPTSIPVRRAQPMKLWISTRSGDAVLA